MDWNHNTIYLFRKSLGLTQEQLAHRIGVVTVIVNRWENQKSLPSPLSKIQLDRLAEETGFRVPEQEEG